MPKKVEKKGEKIRVRALVKNWSQEKFLSLATLWGSQDYKIKNLAVFDVYHSNFIYEENTSA